MQADLDELVNMKIEGSMAELLVKINPKLYREHLRTENGKPMMCVHLKKALYRTICATLLLGENMADTLQEWGFEINP
eukprot:14182777-Ditylum_brightwellii.AAC.1